MENMQERNTASPEIPVQSLMAEVNKATFSTIRALNGHNSPAQRDYLENLRDNLNGIRPWLTKKSLVATSSLAIAATFLSSCSPAVVGPVISVPDGGPGKPTEVSPTATTSPTETATETATATSVATAEVTPDPNAPENVKSVEKATDLVMVKGQGEYYVFSGDKAETYKVFTDTKKYDELDWTIKGEQVAFLNLTQDIVNKGLDANGNKISWIQGFSVTKDKVTGEVKYNLVAENRPTGLEEAKDVLPHFTRFDNSKLDKIALDNIISYLSAVTEVYPVKDLFPADPSEFTRITPKDFVISHTVPGARGRTNSLLFLESNVEGLSPLYLENLISSNKGNPEHDITGDNSPMQYLRQGNIYSPMPSSFNVDNKPWGAVCLPVAVMQPDGSIIILQSWEDAQINGEPIAVFLDKVYIPSNGPTLALIEHRSAYTSGGSVRMKKWLDKQISLQGVFGKLAGIEKRSASADEDLWIKYSHSYTHPGYVTTLLNLPEGAERWTFTSYFNLWLG